MKRRIYFSLGCVCLVAFLLALFTVSFPPLSDEYVLAKKSQAKARARGGEMEVDFAQIPKFKRGWRVTHPLTYIQIGTGVAMLVCFAQAHRDKRKRKANQTNGR